MGPQAGLSWAEGAGEGLPGKQSPTPWTWTACSPLHEPTISRSGDPPAAEPTLAPPKDGGVSGLEELCKVLWAPCLLVAGFPPPASFLRVTPLRGQLLLQSSVAIVEICRGIKAQREGRKETQPRVYPFLLTTQNRICPKALVGMKKCCHLVAAFGNIN